ncbi:uncharacterized protein LOC124156027 [Ischnura elegans]|uniref:uncharacterized protein LOC124156027 n=1 Tax=Ischnura elegans TaxID=197161 RepID=UPI001ED8A4A6|nr:uncharacterized protein LOC124156027 [Ischnura elegans]
MHDPQSTAALPSSSRLLVGRRPPLPLLRRSSSLRSRRSVTSTGSSSSATVATTASGSKRVSFHRDVRVKRIPSYLGERGRFGSGSFKRRHHHRAAPSPSPPPDPSAGLVRRLDPPHSRQALAKEARKVLREADRVTCTTLPLPKGTGAGGGKAATAVPLLLLGRRKQQRRAQPPPRLHISPPLPAGAPLPAVVTFSSAEEGGGASTTDYSSLERPPRERRKKKALSPIIEATTPVIAGPASATAGDYFSARSTGGGESRSIPAAEDGGASGDSLLRSSGRDESSLDSLTREDFRDEDEEETLAHCVETSTGGRMVHSSQMPADRPPLTRGTVTGLAQQLSTTTRRPKGPPPVVGRGYATTLMDAYGADDYIVNHNNNRPFSYTDPSSVQATLPKSSSHPRNGVDLDGIGGLDQRVPRGGKEVIYAQVVVSGRDGGGGGEGGGSSSRTGGGGVKRTVHTSVLNHQRVEKVPVVVAAEGAGRIYSRPKGRKRLGSEGEEEDEEEEDYEEETKTKGEEEEEDEGIAGDMMRIGGGGVGAGGVTSSSYYSHHHRTTSSRAADSGKVDYIDGDYRSRRNAKPFQKSSDPRRIENYRRFDEDDEDDLADRTYRRGSLDYGLNKTDHFGKGLAYNRKDLFDSGIENDSGVGGSGRRRPKTGEKVTVGEGVTAKIVMNGGPNLRSAQIGGSCNNISRVTITNDSPGLGGSKDRFFYYGASPEDSTTLQDKRRGSGSTTTTVNNNNSKSGNVTSSSMVSTRLVRAADKRRDADLPTSSVLIRHWAPSADEKHSGHDQKLVVEESKVESHYHRERRRRRRRTSEGYEEEEEEEIDERNGHPQDVDDGHYRRPRSGKDKGKGRLEDLEEEEQKVNGKDGSQSDIDDYDERNNNHMVTTSSRRYQKKGETTLKKKTTSTVKEEEDPIVVDKKGKVKKGEKEGEEKKKRGFRQFFSRKSGSCAKETTEEKGGATGDYHKSTYDRRKDRADGYTSAEERRSHANSTTNHDPSGRHKDRWFSEDEIDRREDRTPPSRRKYTADGHSSSATLSRLVANNNRKNKAAAANTTASDANTGGRWFKSLDRLTRRKKKEEEEEDGQEEEQRTIPRKETTPPPKTDPVAPGGNKKNLRFFGDTDQESVASGHQRTARNGTRRPTGIMASGRRSGASEEEESGTTTESSAPSQRSVYLHAATVGDIPGPAKAPAPAAQPAGLGKSTRKKAGSREELQQRRPMVTSKTTLSRSVSVLAPWRPRQRPGSNVDVHYDSSGAYTPNPNGGGGMVTGRPPKAPRTANGNGAGVRSSRGMSASVESLQRGGTGKKASPPRQSSSQQRSSREGRDSALRGERRHGSSRRDIHKVGVERVEGPTRGSSGVTVTRSASMPKDSRLAGWWFRRKKVGQATGKENYGGSANRG